MQVPEQLIARRIRELRRQRRLTLQQVSEKADLSKSFLSKVERGNVSISIAALSRLGSVFDVSLGEFFETDEANSAIIYVPRGAGGAVRGHRPKLSYQYEVLVPRRGIRQMQPVVIAVDGRKARFELREHPGEQFIYMMEGEMNYVCSDREFTLRPGDCLYFNARFPHGPKLKRSQRARYLTVFTSDSPTFRKR